MIKDPFKTNLGKNVFYGKYAHGPNDSWHNLAIRLVDDVCGTQGGKLHPILSRDELDTLTDYIDRMLFIPGGRYLYYAGRPLHAWNNCLSGRTKILTKGGWKSLAENAGGVFEVLSPVDGKYYPAEFKYHGEQQLNKITFGPVRGRSEITWEVEATRNHHWPLTNGKDTYDIRVGDVVPANTFSAGYSSEGFVHGFMYGDGNDRGQLRLCGKKAAYLEQLQEVPCTVTYPEFAKGDPCLYYPQHQDYKELPDDSRDNAYVASFIHGWLAADGHSNVCKQLSSKDKEPLEWFRDNAAKAGIVITGKLRHQIRDVKLGDYEYKNHKIYLLNYSYGEDWEGFKVLSIEPGPVESVYCPYEPVHNRIIIDSNIDTFNCFLLRAEEDTREEWSNLIWRANSCLMLGGGIGIDYSRIRPSGRTLTRTGGISSGPLPLMQMVNEIGRNVMQGGSRRSAIYASLNWKHEDIEAFLKIKDWHSMPVGNTGMSLADIKSQDFNFPAPLDMTNISINYDDEWLEMIGDRSKDKIFLENCRQAMKTGEPGFSFNFGAKENETLRNACVTAETLVLTKQGYFPIVDLVDILTEVWNGSEWSKTTPFVTGKKATYLVTLSNGQSVECSGNHEFITFNGPRVKTENLEVGAVLERCPEYPTITLENALDPITDAYSQGFYSGDGNSGYEWSWVYHTKYGCLNRLDGTIAGHETTKKRWKHGPMLDKNFVPINASKEYCVNWLAGLFDSDGTVLLNKNSKNVQVGSIDKEFLKRVQLMCTRLGFCPSLTLARTKQDHSIKEVSYECQALYRLHFGAFDLLALEQLGLKCNRLDISNNFPNRDGSRKLVVVSVELKQESALTYCFTESKNHTGVFNGIYTGQCTEVTSEDDSDVCNLGSINLGNIESLEEFKDVVRLASKFLVCGTVRADLPYDKVKQVREKNRRLGLGLMGIHEWLLKRGNKYEVTEELHKWMEVYRDESKRAADEHCDRLYLNRPVAYRAIAPTGSIGILAGTTTGIEPLFAVAYKRRYLTEGTRWKYEYVVDHTADTLIREYGVNPDKIDTAYSMSGDYERRIKFQADVQDYVDMSISSTINLPAWGSKDNNESHVEGFATVLAKYAPRLRGFTCYPDGSRGGQPITEVPYSEAIGHRGVVFEENDACANGVCGL